MRKTETFIAFLSVPFFLSFNFVTTYGSPVNIAEGRWGGKERWAGPRKVDYVQKEIEGYELQSASNSIILEH